MKYKIYLIIILIIFIVAIIFFITQKNKIEKVCFKQDCFKVQVVSTPEERERGLMDYETLGDIEGMLFVFEKEGPYGFWMQNMSFPIDIIWINNDLKVVSFVKNAQPCINDCKVFYSKNNVLYVLEINSGKVEELGINMDEKVTLNYQ